MRETTNGATPRLDCSTSRKMPSTRKTHDQAVLKRLNVNIGGVFANRLRQHRIDQPDDRCIIVTLEQIGLLGQLLRKVCEVRWCLRARFASTSPPAS